MPHKDKSKRVEYQRAYAQAHSSTERVRRHRGFVTPSCNKPVTNPVTDFDVLQALLHTL